MTLAAHDMAEISVRAGKIIMDIFHSDFAVKSKADRSPVTRADEQAESLILEALKALDHDLPILAEEAANTGHIPKLGNRFALVDPLDGTYEFINRREDFTVNIAIIEHGRPVLGVVYAPAKEKLYVADGPGSAWQADIAPGTPLDSMRNKKNLSIRRAPKAGLCAIVSQSHRTPETDNILKNYSIANTLSAGSSLKFCLLAAGEADLYPRMGRTMEWDTAAGQAVCEAAGAMVLTETGQPLLYGKAERGYDNPHFIVYGDVAPLT